MDTTGDPCDSDVSDTWSLMDLKPEEAETFMKGSVDSGLQSSKEFLTVDNNVEECFELTEMTFTDPLGVADLTESQQNSDLENRVIVKQDWDEDSDGISVIFDEELARGTNAAEHNEVVSYCENVDSIQRVVSNGMENLPMTLNRVWTAPSLFPRNYFGLVALAVLLIAVARQIFVYDDDKEKEKLAAAIENLERLNAANEALQKQIQRSLDAMALNIDTLHRCSPSPTHSTTPTEKSSSDPKELNRNLKELLPLFEFFADQQKSTDLSNLAKRIQKSLDEITVSKAGGPEVAGLDQKLSLVMLKLMKDSSGNDRIALTNRLEHLTDRLERKAKRGKRLVDKDLHIVQWFVENDAESDDIFVKDDESSDAVSKDADDKRKERVHEQVFDYKNPVRTRASEDSNAKNMRPRDIKCFDGSKSSYDKDKESKDHFDNKTPDKASEEVNAKNRRPEYVKSFDKTKFHMKESKESLKDNDKVFKKTANRDKVEKEQYKKKYFKTKQEWLTWQLERGKARENIRQDGGKNRYFQSTGMLVS